MAVGRGENVDDIESLTRHHFQGRDGSNTETLRRCFCARFVEIGNADDTHMRQPLQRLDVKFTDVACANQAHAINLIVCHFRFRTAPWKTASSRS